MPFLGVSERKGRERGSERGTHGHPPRRGRGRGHPRIRCLRRRRRWRPSGRGGGRSARSEHTGGERGKRTVPDPNTSLSVPFLEAVTISGTVRCARVGVSKNARRAHERRQGECALVMLRSETLKLAGKPSSLAEPSAWARARERTESRVTPGRITVQVMAGQWTVMRKCEGRATHCPPMVG